MNYIDKVLDNQVKSYQSAATAKPEQGAARGGSLGNATKLRTPPPKS
jgi:hypothetical protein